MREDIKMALEKNKEANSFFSIRMLKKELGGLLELIKEEESVYYIRRASVAIDPKGDVAPNSVTIKGKKTAMLVVTDKRLLIHYKMSSKEHTEQIPIGDIRSVDLQKDIYASKIRITTSRKVVAVDSSAYKKDYMLLIDALEEAMEKAQESPVTTVPMSESKEDAVKALRGLAALWDDGIISEIEFENKKVELLAKI